MRFKMVFLASIPLPMKMTLAYESLLVLSCRAMPPSETAVFLAQISKTDAVSPQEQVVSLLIIILRPRINYI
jgi:hypothetical protein